MSTDIRSWDRRKVARYVLILTLAVIVLTTSFRTHDVVIRYAGLTGELQTTLYDVDGDRLRTTWFPGPPYEHTVTLAEGDYTIKMTQPEGLVCTQPLSIVDEHPVVVDGCGP